MFQGRFDAGSMIASRFDELSVWRFVQGREVPVECQGWLGKKEKR